ncbi:hypothetical protein MKR65_11460 [Acinetobacter baumannii]
MEYKSFSTNFVKRDKSSDEKRAAIASVIQKFMENDYEFICLGEVGPEDIDFFEKTIFPQTLGYFCAKGIDGVGRTFLIPVFTTRNIII